MGDFIPFVQELLAGWGSVSARRMFGGHGLYHEGLMFAIVMNQQLYLKVDEQNRPEFEALGVSVRPSHLDVQFLSPLSR